MLESSVDEGWWGGGRKSYLGPAEIASFSCRDFNRSNKHDTFWHVVSIGFLYVWFLWTIAVSDFRHLEIYKNLGLLLPNITFTVNSHAYNHFYKSIYLFQILYRVKSVFLLKYTLRLWPRFFIFKFDLNVKHRIFFYWEPSSTEKNSLYIEKNSFVVDYVRIIEVHIVHTWRHMQSE